MSDRELQELKKELRLLRDQVASLQLRVSELEGFEVVSYPSGYPSQAASPTGFDPAEASSASRSTAATSEEASGNQSWEFRLEVAREIGAFLKRAVEGRALGSSGRHKLSLKSRLYIIVKDRSGILYTNPVKIERTWRSARALVEKEGSFGDSIFVGLPSEREAKEAVLEAGFHWPSAEA